MRASQIVTIATAVAALVVLGGCGSSDSTGSPAETSPGAVGKATTDTPTGKKATGRLTLVVDGKPVDTGTPEDCNVNDYEGDPIFAFTASKSNPDTGLAVRLPAEPGTLGEREGNVILPEPGDGDAFQPTLEVTGSWSRDGDTASGHLEGTAKRVSAITASDAPPPTAFTIDFSCTVTDIHLDDVGN